MISEKSNESVDVPVIDDRMSSGSSDPQINIDDEVLKNQIIARQKKLEKIKRRVEKQKIVSAAKAILISELLGSCLVILYMFLFYAKIYMTKQDCSIAYAVLFISSDVLFMTSWVTSFAGIVLRNDKCINYCKYSLALNVLLKLAALIVYIITTQNYPELTLSKLILSLTISMMLYSIIYILVFSYMKSRWAFIPPLRWQRKFNPNLRYDDIKRTSNNQNQSSISSTNTNDNIK